MKVLIAAILLASSALAQHRTGSVTLVGSAQVVGPMASIDSWTLRNPYTISWATSGGAPNGCTWVFETSQDGITWQTAPAVTGQGGMTWQMPSPGGSCVRAGSVLIPFPYGLRFARVNLLTFNAPPGVSVTFTHTGGNQ